MAQRILIIDDEDHIRQVMRLTLEAAGYEAGEAADGPRGLEAFGDGSTWDAVLASCLSCSMIILKAGQKSRVAIFQRSY